MLRIIVEFVPHGNEAKKRIIAEGLIANDGTGTLLSGNYHAAFRERDMQTQRWHQARTTVIRAWARQERGPWALIAEALRELWR